MRKNKYAYFFLLPGLLIMGALVFLPVIRTFFYSLHQYKLTRPDRYKYIGFKNYLDILTSSDFHNALINSFFILIFVLLLVVFISVIVGLLLNYKSRLSPLLTAIAIIPWALPPLVNGIIWQFIFHPSYGFMNKLMAKLGIIDQPIPWINDRYLLLVIVSLVVSWRVIPFCSVLVLSTLQSISEDIYEAARLDGANFCDEFFHITLPYILPTISIILIQATMAAINVFDEIVSLIGYKYEGQTLLIYNYLNTFSFLDFGYGSAITYIIMILSGIIGYFYIRSLRLEETHG